MLISRTPYRISLFGGGTDYPEWYNEHGGSVVSFTINRYCHISFRALPPFFSHRYKVVYSKVEEVKELDDIQHPVVREAIRYYNIAHGVEITHIGDLPARSGMGSSSAFTVGLINLIYKFTDDYDISKLLLAKEAIHLERDVLRENVGIQDQIATAYGGLNHIQFDKNGFEVEPIHPSLKHVRDLSSHLMLFFTGVNRTATASEVVGAYDSKKFELGMKKLSEYSTAAVEAIRKGNFNIVGELLQLGWEVKKGLSPHSTTPRIEAIFDRAMKNGGIGGKLLGAGGGGFLLLFTDPERRGQVLAALSDLIHVPFKFEFRGSEVIFNSKDYF